MNYYENNPLMKTITLEETESLQSRLIMGAKLTTFERWLAFQYRACTDIGAMMELRIMFNVAHAFGIKLKSTPEMSKYKEFLRQVWEAAKGYEVIVNEKVEA